MVSIVQTFFKSIPFWNTMSMYHSKSKQYN